MAESITRKNIDLDILDYYDGKIKNYVDDKAGTGSLTIDDTLSDTSTNPVQNKIVKQAIDDKADKSLYSDTTINVGRKAETTVGAYSTAEGDGTTASGDYSHAEGIDTTASSDASHAEGMDTTASNGASHAEGMNTTASGMASHAEGNHTTAIGNYSHAEGSNYSLSGTSLSDRTVTISNVDYTISGSTAYGINTHAEGSQSFAYGYSSHAEGVRTTASGGSSHAEGMDTTASNSSSHAEGDGTTASGNDSHAEGYSTTASGLASHAEGYNTTASKTASHAEGAATTASGSNAHAEGGNTTASGDNSHAEGNSNYKITQLITDFSGNSTTNDDIINAWNTKKFSVARGKSSHVEGQNNLSLGHYSHAEGLCTIAIGNQSHTSGYYTKALHDNEVAYGKYNQSNDDTLFSVGDGTADDARHNAFEITTTGGKLHDKDIAVDVANPNLLINPDFKINQRAVSGTFSDAGKYFVDRWKLDSGTVTVHTNGTLTLNGTMSQILENAAGTDVTASVSAGAAAYDDSTKTFTITGDGAVISWVKLERGGIATAFVPPDPAMEQMKCYRFFYRVGGKGIANPNDLSNSNRIAYHTGANAWVSAIFQFPVEMRVVPTAKITGTPWCFKELYSTKSDVAGELNMDLGTGVAITAETSGYEIRMITDYLRTLKTPDGYVGPSNSTGYTDFDAEIY